MIEVARSMAKPKTKVNPQTFEMVGVNSLHVHPANPRQGDVGAIYESIEHNGFYGAIIVQRSSGAILAGNHRYMAAVQSGITEVPVLYVDVDDDRALRILLADNRTNDKASYDNSALAEILSDLANTSDLLGTGYDGDDLDELIQGLSRDSGLEEAMAGLPDGDKSPFQQMTFTLHDDQAEQVKLALEQAKRTGNFQGSPNENSNGNALAMICGVFVGG